MKPPNALAGRACLGVLWACGLTACVSSVPGGPDGKGLTPDRHTFFPIVAGATHAFGGQTVDGQVTCESCHPPAAASFKDISCTGCHTHAQPATDLVHVAVADYRYDSRACVDCHPDSAKRPFSHPAATVGKCAVCHDVQQPFAALPVANFTHPSMAGADCGACHSTAGWKGGEGGTRDGFDPRKTLSLEVLLPRYQGTSILSFTPQTQALPMPMRHQSLQLPQAALGACSNCHVDAAAGVYYPGRFHDSIENLVLAQPTLCSDCHGLTEPTGFVGPLAVTPARSPSSGEMKHDAVAWAANVPTSQRLVTQECGTCHRVSAAAGWAAGRDGTAPANYHAALAAASASPPSSCVDCHANSRPTQLLTNATAALPINVVFDHQHLDALGDCQNCHAASGPGFTTFRGGQFHLAGASSPATCLPCHDAERPTSTAGWQNSSFTQSPFDYVTNAANISHGAGQDCAVCHAGPGTGQWGSTQNWQGGHFGHGPNSLAAKSCVNCHSTQRPDLLPGATAAQMATLLGFDHALNGQGDCYGCHQATVSAGQYVNLVNPSTGMLPGGHWAGGQAYPGSTLVSSTTRFITVQEGLLNRSGPLNLVTGMSNRTSTYYNAMLHTAAGVPAAVNAGPTGMPDETKCWHCHTHTNGTVTSFVDGVFHASLSNYRATPGGAVSPLPQPTSGCIDCHDPQMRPQGIVRLMGSNMKSMDHDAFFSAAVTIGGKTVSNANGLDCVTCHRAAAGSTDWANGEFHPNVGAAQPQDCTVCHYPLMADAAQADVTQGTTYAMRHRSGQITVQKCDSCHAGALARAVTRPVTAALWRPGSYHGSLLTQPGACLDCHAASEPVVATRSTVSYPLAEGGTASNTRQWMSHLSSLVAGRDCVVCHQADAQRSGSAWNAGTPLHAKVTNATGCKECHGLNNGMGSVAGTNNNLPAGLVSSATVSTIAGVSGSGVPAGTKDLISHADLNVANHDCNFCHTQIGPSSTAGVMGQEWAQARFHANFSSAANPLLINNTSARCSNCHLNVKPAAGYSPQNHSAFTNASGSQDCASCHSFPGTGSASAPNWKGAAGVPPFISVGGFTIAAPPAAAGTVQGGIADLPHPTVAAGTDCTTCHASASGGRRAVGYDHASNLINANCRACHEAGSDLVGTAWNPTASGASTLQASCGEGSGSIRDRAGDTRAIGLGSLACTDKATSKTCGSGNCVANHFYPADCHECHNKPSGVTVTKTGASYVSGWQFPHSQGNMQQTTCCMCHNARSNGSCRP
ncbi:MAG: hypothetical protein K1X64_09380 [Myxococcaceae bacterium]|nr:hypothetical protein [Myxococcaceae bacterium]